MYLSTSNKTLNKYKVEEHYREEIQQITPLLLNVTIISNGKNKNYRLHEKNHRITSAILIPKKNA
jgi:hypothetical protein